MRIDELKTALNITTGIDVARVIFDPMQDLNTEQNRSYPTIMWDLNSLEFTTRLNSNRAVETTYTMRVYILEWLDTRAKSNSETKHEKWQAMHANFEEYVLKVNQDAKIHINPNVSGEFFTEGTTSVESEIAIGYDVTVTQSC